MNYQPFHNKASFAKSVDALFSIYPDTAERIEIVQRMTDEYFVRFGQYPDPALLSMLGTFLLRETDGGKAKPARDHLSHWQEKRRQQQEIELDPARLTKCAEGKLYGKRVKRINMEDAT